MSKAEDRAIEKYPKKIEWVGNQWDGAPFDVNSEKRFYYQQGYEQAEKELIDKGIEFLKDHLEGYDIFGSDIERSVESFKLAMKDE